MADAEVAAIQEELSLLVTGSGETLLRILILTRRSGVRLLGCRFEARGDPHAAAMLSLVIVAEPERMNLYRLQLEKIITVLGVERVGMRK